MLLNVADIFPLQTIRVKARSLHSIDTKVIQASKHFGGMRNRK